MAETARGGDDKTIAFYDRESPVYSEYAASFDDVPALQDFASRLTAGSKVLDFGCGSAWAANRFRELGFQVHGFDGSEGLAAEARKKYGIEVTVGRFEDFNQVNAYDGIWASFCLLHDSRDAMPDHLARLHRALTPGGQLYLGLKEGTGSHRDSLDRLYVYYTEPEIRGLLDAAGFNVARIIHDENKGYDGVDVRELHIYAVRR